jgi:hypothetical protein
VAWADIRRVAIGVRELLAEHGLVGWPKTSGSRGIHVNVRIQPRWTFAEVRGAALALSREMERRLPGVATSKWWKEERQGVFLDYNQNAKDRTTCSAYSVRPLPDARVSAPLIWDEVPDVEPADFTVLTMPKRFAEIGDPKERMDDHPGSLDALLDLAARDESSGLPDAPWPPNYVKQEGEAPRVAPSRAKAAGTKAKKPRAAADPSAAAAVEAPPADADAPGRAARRGRRITMPLLVIAHSPDKQAALAGLDRWKARHPEAARLLAPEDVLVDGMRGRSSVWYRIRVNLKNVPEAERPPQETPDPDDDPTREWREALKREANGE